MTGKEYLMIFEENGLQRSKLVRFLENQIKILDKNEIDSTEIKWIAIEIAEKEKEQGFVFLDSEN